MDGIAIIGISCALPGAQSPEEFWQNLKNGTESITSLSNEELLALGMNSQELQDPNYVKAGGFIDNIDLFDADFFSYTRPEAEFTDPQQRILLESCHELLEKCGYANTDQENLIGMYASTGTNQYFLSLLMQNKLDPAHFQDLLLNNSPDCVATRISYKLNLTGPSMTVQCGCSSGLAAVHQARISLLSHQCNIALVGASVISNLSKLGYKHTEGGFLSGDGHCRAFDAKANGTLFTSGVVVLALKRLEDAIKHRDSIYAVIKSSAINNDGANKAGFTAPSVKGQEEVIRKALKIANVSADTISYVEAHGTATPLGDPIEVAALAQAFRHTSNKKQYCALGSVKTNIGHLDVAAGLAGLAKTALALKHRTIPASLHFTKENPELKLADSPFYVNTKTTPWESNGSILRAGVSAFGFGGTNVHLVMEEAPVPEVCTPILSKPQLIKLSTKTKSALYQQAKDLQEFLQVNSDISIIDLAYTLFYGRKHYQWCYTFTASSIAEVIAQLNQENINPLTSEAEDLILDNQGVAKRILLPTYPFNKQSYWLLKEKNREKQELKSNRYSNMTDCIYHLNWRLSPALIDNGHNAQKNYLIFINNTDDFKPILAHYKTLGHRLCLVYPSDHFEKLGEELYSINPKSYNDYLKLLSMLKSSDFNVDKIIHTWLLQLTSEINKESSDRFLGFYSLIFISKALEELSLYSLKNLIVLGSGFYRILGNENLSADKTMAIAAAWSINQEYASIQSKVIDIYEQTGRLTPALTQQLVHEIEDEQTTDVIAYRNTSRWIPLYEHIAKKVHKVEKPVSLDEKPTYIIIGGLGNVALVYAHYLAKKFHSNIVLVNRREYLENTLDPKKLAKLTALKTAAHQVVLLSGDVTDTSSLQTVFEHTQQLFGKITGIVHAAGIATEKHYQPLNQLTIDACEEVFSPKVQGLAVVAHLAKNYHVKQVLVISSISSVLAGIGLSAYAASHLYLDAFVQLQNSKECAWSMINWEAWNFYQDEQQLLKDKGDLGSDLDLLAISIEEGEGILELAMHHHEYPQVIVSTTELNPRCDYWLRKGYLKDQQDNNPLQQYDPRPEIKSDYVQAANTLEETLVKNWQNILGIQPVGVLDNFFELGGHSLLALKFVNLFNQEHSEKISFIDLFNYASIRELANHLLASQVDTTNVNNTLNERVAKQNAYFANRQRRITEEQ